MTPYRIKKHRQRSHHGSHMALVPFIDMLTMLVVFLLLGYPVAFSLAANGLIFGFIGIELGLFRPDFLQALDFVNKVGELAEEQGHHPSIGLEWGKVEVTTWTHKINGLTESDFILGTPDV